MADSRVQAFGTWNNIQARLISRRYFKMRMDLLVYCAVLSVALTCISTISEGAPTSSLANGAHDERWRLVSGLETAYQYTNVMQCGQEPLLNVTGDLVNILGGVCELLELHRLTQRMYNESNLHVILEQNILDICHWLNLLVTLNDPDITASQRFLQINDSCRTGHMPRITSYCMETGLDSLYDDVYLPVSDYYTDIVVDQNIPSWLNSSDIPTADATSIQLMLSQQCLD